jgi:ABC-2 type transport system permease protein
MKLRAIFRFELAYQICRPSTWIIFAVVIVFSYLNTGDDTVAEALQEDFFLNSPFTIAKTTVVGTLMWLLAAGVVAGGAAARDVETGMHPLTWTCPISKTEYLGGRFLAAFCLNAFLLVAVQVGILLAVYQPGVHPEVIGPFRPAAFLTAYGFISLPTAFAATSIQFWLAARSGRTSASYFASFLLFLMGFFIAALLLYYRGLGTLVDPIGIRFIIEDLAHQWTPAERKWRLLALEGGVLWNRLVWLGVGITALVVTWMRFRFAHRSPKRAWWRLGTRRRDSHPAGPVRVGIAASTTIAIPRVPRTFGLGIQARQTVALAWDSFRMLSASRVGLALLAGLPLLTFAAVYGELLSGGVPRIPTTALVLSELTAPLSAELSRWTIIPLLLVFCAGELVWRERSAGLSELTDVTPTSEWSLLLSRFLAMGLVIATAMALLAAGGMLAQVVLGYHDFEIGLYLRILFGLQFVEYFLFGILAVVLHVLVDHKHMGHLAAIVAYAFIAVPSLFGVERSLFVYGTGPGWSYSDIRGFGASLELWAWFRLYWLAWALLLAGVARLFWARGRELDPRARLRAARRRFTRQTAGAVTVAIGLVLGLGGFVFYETNVRGVSLTDSEYSRLRADYEQRYGMFEGIPQPRLVATRLHVEIDPERRSVEIEGMYVLVNRSPVVIDSIHLAIVPGAMNGAVLFDRTATTILSDDVLGHRIFGLEEPLQPGDSLRLQFTVLVDGFRNRGADASVVPNGTFFTNADWLPAIGYQPRRELSSATDRRKHGLPARPLIASLHDVEARRSPGEWTLFEAIVGTAENQIAVAPGALRRTWTESGRRYFHYATDGPIRNDFAFFSAEYGVREARWNDVAIRIYHHPGHTANLDRFVGSIRASLDYYTREFGPYPYSHLTAVEFRGNEIGMHADPTLIRYSEETALLNPWPRDVDLPFALMAHEVSHQWWGHQLEPAFVEGGRVIGEGLAEYSAIRVLEETLGREHLLRYMASLRRPFPYAPIHRGEPLMRGVDPYTSYRRGPFALYALSEYVGSDRVNSALRRLLRTHPRGEAPLATMLDLYRELQSITPDSLQYLLHDLFQVNTFWEFSMERVTAEQIEAGLWQLTLDVRARKLVVDSAGAEREVPLDEWVEIGVFAPVARGNGRLNAPLHLQRHRIRSGRQTITVTVAGKPVLAGIDPYHVLDWEEREDDDNIQRVKVEG